MLVCVCDAETYLVPFPAPPVFEYRAVYMPPQAPGVGHALLMPRDAVVRTPFFQDTSEGFFLAVLRPMFANKILISQDVSRSKIFAHVCTPQNKEIQQHLVKPLRNFSSNYRVARFVCMPPARPHPRSPEERGCGGEGKGSSSEIQGASIFMIRLS